MGGGNPQYSELNLCLFSFEMHSRKMSLMQRLGASFHTMVCIWRLLEKYQIQQCDIGHKPICHIYMVGYTNNACLMANTFSHVGN